MPEQDSIEIRIEGDEFTSKFGRPDLPTFHYLDDGTVELRNIPRATFIARETASQIESAGGMDWSGVRMTITRDNDGLQLNTAASNGVFRWELHPAHFTDGWCGDQEWLIGRLIEAKPNA
ncbi:hypothetical protein [Mycobacteroides franklinii]|uniref:Uncharacterized protein n=1 Tax=Mycobacteroides franklinii TaxID=948102 RepID=A0A4R5P7D3_9MYCO|nr:hypothetical protein [Mycobacteroides franklinii]ORA62184.1 hypothetical protein BST24_08560 [Mycobacteroides franklinii]TDH18981.1 hypothetical protein EJ571_20580 [Mycobacteroides franklinii]